MIHLSTILVWVFGLLAVIAASPISQPTPSDLTERANDSSLQLVFGEMLGNHFWWLFQGPQGIGVDMCGLDEQFELVKLWPHPGTANIDSPPFPTKITVKVRYDGRQECSYYNNGNGNAGRLVCADPSLYSTDFKRDPQWDKPTEVCKGKRMHRGYFVEYGT